MQIEDLTDATHPFHSDSNELKLKKISNQIFSNPQNSMLYSNRALIYFQLKNFERAIGDLQRAININHLNYIAYFNLFSLKIRMNGFQKDSFQDLCCSLSILYFLRAKNHKQITDVETSLQYCQNNIEAHILKAMMHLSDNNLKFALDQIDRALCFDPQNSILKRLKYFLRQKNGQSEEMIRNDMKLTSHLPELNQKTEKNRRLQSSLQMDQINDYEKEISFKLKEFSQIYIELSNQFGVITQRIKSQNEKCIQTKGSILSQKSQISEISQKQKNLIKNDDIQNFPTAVFTPRASELPDYFILNEREEFYQQNSQVKQQSFDIPYDLYNKKFIKKEESNKGSIQISKEKVNPVHQQQQNHFNYEQSFREDLLNSDKVAETSFAGFILPEPQSLQTSESQIQQTKERTSLPFIALETESPVLNPQQNILEIQQTPQIGNLTDEQSDAILSYSSQTKELSNYGKIMTKENKNIKFHESQVMEKDFIVYEIDENGEITLIDDLISESSNKAQQKNDASRSFTKKDHLDKLISSNDRAVKSLQNSLNTKNLHQEKSQNQTKTNFIDKQHQKFEVIKLYPFSLPKKQIFFNFQSVQFSKKYKVTHLDEVYLVAVYHLSIPKYKMKTQSKKIQGFFCNWSQKFPEMNLLQQPRGLKITLFNKAKGRNARNQLIGQAQKAVTQTGQMRIPLYEKKILVAYVKCAVWAL